MSTIKVVMDDGTEITLTRRDGTGTMEGLSQHLYFRAWQASTPWNAIAFGATEDAAIASLLDRIQGSSGP